MKSLIYLIKNAEIVFTLVANPMMKGEVALVVLEQSTDLRFILKEHMEHRRDSVIKISFRIKK